MHVKFTHRTVHENTVVFVCRQHSVSLLEVVHALSGEVESTGVQVGHLAHFECPFINLESFICLVLVII